MKITSARVDGKFGHDIVSVWIDGKLSGTLTVGRGEGMELLCLLEDGAGLGELTGQGFARVVFSENSGHPDAIVDTERLYESAVSPGEEERLRWEAQGRKWHGPMTPGCKDCRLIGERCGKCEGLVLK